MKRPLSITPLEEQLAAALARAEKAEAQLARLLSIQSGRLIHASKKKALPPIAAALLNALDTDWASALDLQRRLDFKVSRGTIYNRMRGLASTHNHVEGNGGAPEKWRLKEILKLSPSKSEVKSTNTCSDQYSYYKPQLLLGNCLDVLKAIPDRSVDLILADLPYSTTRISIDQPIPLEPLFAEYRRLITEGGNIVLFGSQPFTTMLINQAPDLFKYSLVWEKHNTTGFQRARDKPLKSHEDILIFSKGATITANRTGRRSTYNPTGAREVLKVPTTKKTSVNFLRDCKRLTPDNAEPFLGLENCPRSVLKFAKDRPLNGEKLHPFAKPIALLEMLILQYSHHGDLVLDNCMGSGSTILAAVNSGRKSLGIEIDREWYAVANERVDSQIRAVEGTLFSGGAPISIQPKASRTDA